VCSLFREKYKKIVENFKQLQKEKTTTGGKIREIDKK
jgi:hypothetical protein